MTPQLALAGGFAAICFVLTVPLALDDLVFRSGYVLRPSADAIEIVQPILLSEQPRIVLLKGSLSVPAAFSGKPRTGEALSALVKGGSVRLMLKDAVFQVELSSQSADGPGGESATGEGRARFPLGPISPMLAVLNDATFERLSIVDGVIRLVSKTRPDVVLNDVGINIVVKRRTAMRIKGQLSYLGEVVFIDTTVGSKIERRGGTRMPIRAQVRSEAVSAMLDGHVDWRGAPSLSASAAEIEVPSLRKLARWLGRVWPSGEGLRDFSASGALEWSQGVMALHNGQIQMDGTTANGELQLDMTRERPAINGTLAVPILELSPYLQGFSSTADEGGGLLARFKGVGDLALPMLGYLDGDLRVSADKVRLWGLETNAMAAGLNVRDGRLFLDVADLNLPDGGQAHATLTVASGTLMPNMTLNGSIVGANLGQVTRALVGTELVSGIGNVDLDLSASGVSGIDVLSKLQGTVSVVMPTGGEARCSVASLAAAALIEPLSRGDVCSTSTILGSGRVTGVLDRGILSLSPLSAGAGTLVTTDPTGQSSSARDPTSTLEGSVDLVTRQLDLTLASAPEMPADVAGPQVGAATGDLGARLQVRVRGRPEAPTIVLNAP